MQRRVASRRRQRRICRKSELVKPNPVNEVAPKYKLQPHSLIYTVQVIAKAPEGQLSIPGGWRLYVV